MNDTCEVCGDPDCYGPSGRHRPAAPAAEAGEMTEVGELRVRLQHVEHDLQHVARERDQAAAEAARLRETVARVEAACTSSEAWHRRYDLPLFDGYIRPPTIEIQAVRRALNGEP